VRPPLPRVWQQWLRGEDGDAPPVINHLRTREMASCAVWSIARWSASLISKIRRHSDAERHAIRTS
jgi:hypothetical protein